MADQHPEMNEDQQRCFNINNGIEASAMIVEKHNLDNSDEAIYFEPVEFTSWNLI